MIAETIPQLSSLSSDEKIILAAELWKQAAGQHGADPDPALVAALRERLDHFQKNPQDCASWEVVRARISKTSA